MKLLSLITSLVAGVAAAAADTPPNVVLIVADDLGYADLSCYGAKDIHTPNLDRLATQGTRHKNFCVAQAVCTASRAALLSGCYPNRLGMAGALNHTSRTGIHPNEDLLPELFRAKGYATAHYGKWHLGTRPEFSPLKNGFDVWAGLPYSNDNGPLHPTIRGIPPLPFVENDKTVEHDPDQSQFTARFTKLAVGFIKEHAGKKPFFLYLPHVMPHVPIFASPAFRGTSKRGLYGDVVQELDAGVGDVLKALADTGVEKNTLVVFLSDNGPFLSYGDHAGRADPFREGKLTTYEGGVRVPFILRWPGHVPQGKTETRFSTGLDVLPTLVALAGLKSPRNRIDGEDLSELWLGREGAPVRNRFAYYAGTELQAVRRGQFKLHLPHSYLAVDGEPGRGGKPANVANMKPKQIEESGIQGIASRHGYKVLEQSLALYDLDTDPGERTDVKDRYPKVVTELKAWAQIVAQDLGDTLTKTPGRGQRPVGTVEK